jgi:NADPH-dependent 2,4-dienoyl-CoA reductase/sulfur reductase-like enzyme
MGTQDGIVIVGGGLAAARVARAFKDAGGEGPVSILSADTDPPYNRPPLSKGFLRGEIEADAVFVEPEEATPSSASTSASGAGDGVQRTRRRWPRRRRLAPYDRLVLASGSLPRPLGTPGETLEGVHTYRTLRDATAVRTAAESASSALVIGGGSSAWRPPLAPPPRPRGHQVDLGDALYASLQALRCRSLERLYRDRGVEVILGDVVAEFRGSGGKLTGAVTRAGREIEAELAIIGVGVQPSTSYLAGCGVELDRGTVPVDERFATNVPGIYAVGDIANFSDPIFGHRRLIQHWTNASYQGDRLGRLLAGQDTPYDQVAYFFSEVFGTKIGLLGDLDGGHELVMRGSLERAR